MGVNDDRLSAGEQNELRARVTAGAGRMSAARRRRMQAITGGAAVLLVAAVVGAVALTATGSPDRVANPIETSTTPAPTPTATSAPTPDPDATEQEEAPAAMRGIEPFGGDCNNALTTEEVGDFYDVRMALMADAWSDGSVALQGGLGCTWSNDPGYGEQNLNLWVYPLSVVEPYLAGLEEASGCDTGSYYCARSEVRDGLWVRVFASATGGSPDPTELMNLAFEHAAQWPSPAPAERTAEWWPPVTCDDLTASVDIAGALGMPVSVAVASPPQGQSPTEISPGEIPAKRGAAGGCTFNLSDHSYLYLSTASGGSPYAADLAAIDGASPLAVRGGYLAWTLPDYDPWEQHNTYVVVSDGVNLVRVGTSNVDGRPSDDALGELGARVIEALNGTVG